MLPPEVHPKDLSSETRRPRSVLEDARKQVTVLFADLKGSMELLAHLDPEDARALLDSVLEHMIEAVRYYEGTVNNIMGDGIMALFGAPNGSRRSRHQGMLRRLAHAGVDSSVRAAYERRRAP